jgi:hypothetical protein
MAYRDLDGLIGAARGAEAPSDAQRAQVREGLARRIASGDALPDLDGASLSPPLARSWLRGAGALPLGLGGLAVAGLAVYALGRDVPSDARDAASAPPAARPEPALDVEGARPEAAPGSANAALPEEARASTPATASGSSVSREASPAPALSGAPVEARGSARARASSTARAPGVDPEAERRALARVQHALRDGRFVEALAGLDRDDRAFTGGALVEERAAARVLARCGSGDAAGAQQLATAFVARYPGSPLRSRVLASCPASAGERAR